MYYLMILFAALLFSMQFLFNDGFRRIHGNTLQSSLRFSLYASAAGLLFLLIMHEFQLSVTVFSVIVALVYSCVCVTSGYLSIQALTYANLSVYSIFCMIGGMILPVMYGLFTGEVLSGGKIVCCILIAISVLATQDLKQEQSRKAYKYYMGVFVLNGMVGVISAFHQSCSDYCVDSQSFLMLTKIMTILLCTVLLFLQKDRKFLIHKKAVGYCAGFSIVNTVGNLLLLIALLRLPASVQYPIVTGGTIVFAVVIDKLRKTAVSKREMLAAAAALVATVFMMF